MSFDVHLDEKQLEHLADLIADKLALRSDGEVVTAGELAERIGCTREFVYNHAQQLGVIRLGAGERPRLLFRWPAALDRLDSAPNLTKSTPRNPRKRTANQANLLPIRGQR